MLQEIFFESFETSQVKKHSFNENGSNTTQNQDCTIDFAEQQNYQHLEAKLNSAATAVNASMTPVIITGSTQWNDCLEFVRTW